MKVQALILVLILAASSCYKEQMVYDSMADGQLNLPLILKLDGQDAGFDVERMELRYTLNADSVQSYQTHVEFNPNAEVFFEGQALKNHSLNDFGPVKLDEAYQVRIVLNDFESLYQLRFTNLPIVQLVAKADVLDEPEIVAKFHFFNPHSSHSTSGFIEIENRGGTSLRYDKKSIGFSFLQDIYVDEEVSTSLNGWKENEDWILDAMYIDPGRVRNRLAFRIWESMDDLNHHSIQGIPVEVYLNRSHQGVYCLNEKVNPEFLNMEDPEALLYKTVGWHDGAATFDTYVYEEPEQLNWQCWEQKYPEDRLAWETLGNLRQLIVNGSDQDFTTQIANHVDIDNLVDYFILINLASASDNIGKNTFLYRLHGNEPLKIQPWDLDGTFGITWNGSPKGTETIMSNGLYTRLLSLNPDQFVEKLKSRYTVLRSSALQEQDLLLAFADEFQILRKSSVISIENQKWNLNIDIDQEEAFLKSWLSNRISFLDAYFSAL